MDFENSISDNIFSDLGISADQPKEFVINIANYVIEVCQKQEWIQYIQLEDFHAGESESSFEFFTIGSPLPMLVRIKIIKDLKITSKGVPIPLYNLSIDFLSDIEVETLHFYNAEEYLISFGSAFENVYDLKITRTKNGTYLLQGSLSNEMNLSFVPINSNYISDEDKAEWPYALLQKADFNIAALELSNISILLNEHYSKQINIIQWFKERGIQSIGAISGMDSSDE